MKPGNGGRAGNRTPGKTAATQIAAAGNGRPAEPRLALRLFGTFLLEQDGVPLPRTRTRKEQSLLALLALQQPRGGSSLGAGATDRGAIDRSALAATLWPDSSEAQALDNLRRSVYNLRQVLGPEHAFRLRAPTPRQLRLDLSSGAAWCDALAFDAAVARNDPEGWREAIALYRGPLLEGCHEEWVFAERVVREQQYLTALERRAEHARTALGDNDEAIRCLQLVAAADPYRESAQRALLEALAARGDLSAATHAYRQLRRRLHDELRTEPAPETRDLFLRLQDRVRPPRRGTDPTAAPPHPATASRSGGGAPPHRLPVPITSLVGRDEETAAIAALLRPEQEGRLVTLVGTAGIGKTRLALQVGQKAAAETFPDGACFVALAPLSQPPQIVPALLTVLGLREADYRPAIELLCDYLRERRMLLLLDNCEHLIEEAARVAETLLTRCPYLRLLATSREALRLPGEHCFRVPSLPVPPPQETGTETAELGALLASPSVRLFAERAGAVSRTFTVNRDNADAVAMICRRLDGLPLALELAAGRIPVLTPQQIAARLEDRFALLTGGSRTAPPRQQTLRAALDWSCDLLCAPERTLLERLSVFAGDFGAEAVQQVAGPLPEDTGPLLFSLVEKSLVTAEEKKGEVRYALLETIRAFADTQLAASGARDDVRRRHREYYLAWAETVDRELRFREPARWAALLDAEQDNLRQALRFCQEDPDGGEAGQRLAGALAAHWDLRGYLSEGRKFLQCALSHPGAREASAAIRARTLHHAGQLAWAQGDYPAARAFCQEALALYRARADDAGTAGVLGSLGDLERDQGEYRAAHARYSQALRIYRRLSDRHGIGSALVRLAILTRLHGDLEAAAPLFEESLALLRATGDRQDIALALNGLGNVKRHQGDFAAARALYEESLALRRELGYKPGVASTLNSLGNLAMNQRDYAVARTLFAQSLALQQETSNRSGIAYALESLGRAAFAEGDTATGRSFCQEALRLFRELGDRGGIAGTLRALGAQAVEQGDDAAARALLSESLRELLVLEDRSSGVMVLEMFLTLAAHAPGQGERALRLWGAWTALCERHGIFVAEPKRRKLEAALSPLRHALGKKAAAQFEESGRAMTWEQASAYALEGTEK